MKIFDAIVVPGGGVRENGALPPWVENRLERALELQDRARFILLLSAGTPHRPPPLDERGFPLFESLGGARYLLKRGVEVRKLLTETSSYDTLGNAFFSRVIHAEPLGLQHLLVITSAFHMPRAAAIFQWVYGLQGGRDLPYEVQFEPVEDRGLPVDALAERRQREAESLDRLAELQARIHTLAEFHHWLYTEHAAYAVGKRSNRADGPVLGTY
ncbi:MAG TPA: YdcF family protein [Anaerolineaceae bacterium]|nr:YdcF family protein [Anaerolineaceae bacterium]